MIDGARVRYTQLGDSAAAIEMVKGQKCWRWTRFAMWGGVCDSHALACQ